MSLLAVALVSGLLWFVMPPGRAFPTLGAGSYIGTLSGVWGEGESIPFYVERAPESTEVFVAVLAEGWEPQIRTVHLSDSQKVGSGGRAEARGLPLLIAKGDYQLELSGTGTSAGTSMGASAQLFQGIVRDRVTGREGRWVLAPIRSPPGDAARSASDIRLWLMLRAELEEVDERLQQVTDRLPQQRAQIEKLEHLLVEGEELRSRANDKFKEAETSLASESQALQLEQKKLRALEESLAVSLKVTAAGKLVSLARESLEREFRIIDSLLRSSSGMSSEDLEREYQRAQELIALRDEVADEANRARQLAQSAEPRARRSWGPTQ